MCIALVGTDGLESENHKRFWVEFMSFLNLTIGEDFFKKSF